MQPVDVVPLQDVSPADWLDADGHGVPLGEWLGILRDVLARHTATPDRCWFSLWEGWPVPQWWRASAPTFHLPHREHLLFAGGLEDLLVIAGEFACAGVEYPDGCFVVIRRELEREGGGAGRMPARYPGYDRQVPRPGNPELAARCREQSCCVEPSLWWPEDRAWVVAREVDSDAVYVAGSRALADRLLEERRLAAGKVALEDPITIED